MKRANSLFAAVLVLAVPGTASADSQGSPVSAVSVPFQFDPIHQPYIVVRASVSGHEPVSMVFDMGATLPLLLDSRIAKRWGLRPSPGVELLNGDVLVSNVSVSDFQFLDLSSKSVLTVDVPSAAVIDLSGTLQFPTPGIVGLIGPGSGGWPSYEIDYGARTLRFTRGSPFEVGAHTLAFEQTVSGDVFMATSPSGAPMRVLVDTGGIRTSIRPSLVSASDLAGSYMSLSATVDSLYLGADVVVPTLTIGGCTLHDVDVTVDMMPENRGVDVILGEDVLPHFDLRVDDSTKHLCLTSTDDVAKLPRLGDYDFVPQVIGSRVVVSALEDGSPAAAAGIRNGDVLLTCNGKPLAGMATSNADLLCSGLVGDTDTFTVQRGKEVHTFSYRLDSNGRYPEALVGVVARRELGQYFVVTALVPHCPAARAGLKAGDSIVSINGIKIKGATFTQLLEPVQDQTVTLVVKSPGESSPRTMRIVSKPQP
jgi:hypothetical protein